MLERVSTICTTMANHGNYQELIFKDGNQIIITKYLMTPDSEILEATYQSYLQVTDQGAYPNMEGIRNALEVLAQRVPAAKSKKPDAFVNTSFLMELEKERFFEELY